MATDSTGRRLFNAPKNWPDLFIAALAESSNVKAAADEANVSQALVYKKRRTDPAFALRWFEALAEGYDRLEMDLLERLRTGRLEEVDEDGNRRKFDVSTAFRCISAHRESVAREKGRRRLSDEVITVRVINARIDEMRAKELRNQAREANRKRTGVVANRDVE